MNRIKVILVVGQALSLLLSCQKAEERPGEDPKPVHGGDITIMVQSDNQRKVTLQEDYSVHWDKGDEISLVGTLGNSKLTALDSGPSVNFHGTVPEGETLPGAFALYPYDSTAILSVGSINSSFLHNQSRKLISPMLGTVANSGSEYKVAMKNVGGLLEFSLERNDITQIIFEGNDGEWLSGPVSLTMSSGEPVVMRKDKVPGCNLIVFSPDSSCFKAGTYYVSVPAVTLAKGISTTLFSSEGKKATRKGSESLSIARSHVKPLGNIDMGLEWKDIEPDTLKVSFSSGWPFTEALPSGSYTTNPAFIDQVHDFYTTEGKAFTIYAKRGLAYLSSAENFKMQGDENDYILLPALEGKYLTGIRIRTGREGLMRIPSIKTEDGSSNVPGGYPLAYPYPSAGCDYSWKLYDTKLGARYRIGFECSGYYDNYASDIVDYSACIQEIELLYSARPLEETNPRIWRDVEDKVPDFSRVGYQYGDKSIPDYPVGITLTAPGDDSDCTQMIQNAVNSVHSGMAVLLKQGTYCVEGNISISRNNVVLRGEGEKTIIKATGTRGEKVNDCIVSVGTDLQSVADWTTATPVIENAACGQMYVRVENPGHFMRGDRVIVGRMPFQKWIHDLKMDNIIDTLSGKIPYQELSWKPQSFHQKWERTVVGVEGDKLFFENPIVMSLTSDYCSAYVVKVVSMRNSEVGIENLKFDSSFDETIKTSTTKWAASGEPKWYYSDENHAWRAIVFGYAEHCWVRNVIGEHLAMGVVDCNSGSKNITITDCKSLSPVSVLSGSRRYAFYIRKGQLCLVRNCTAERDRHAFVNGATVCGPNVYSRCSATYMCAEIGPHQYWATGTLFDCVSSDNDICLHDRSGRGGSSKTPGQGWAAANCVLWNCVMESSPYSVVGSIVCQSPWVSARNWAFGCAPSHSIKTATIPYFDGLVRPEGEWSSKGSAMPDESLYEKQRASRTTPALDFPNVPEGYGMDEYYRW